MSMITPVTDQTFNELVLNSEQKVLVYFWTSWCAPCKGFSPIVAQLSEEFEDIVFYKMNLDENPEVTLDFSIFSVPTVKIFKNGELVKDILGARTKRQLLKDIQE